MATGGGGDVAMELVVLMVPGGGGGGDLVMERGLCASCFVRRHQSNRISNVFYSIVIEEHTHSKCGELPN